MDNKISIDIFSRYVELAKYDHPNAKVTSIGTSFNNGKTNFIIFLDDNGKEVNVKIPYII